MSTNADLGRFIMTLDPKQLHVHVAALQLNATAMTAESLLPTAVPGPAVKIPVAAPLTETPDPAGVLSRFAPYAAVVVTFHNLQAYSCLQPCDIRPAATA